MVIFTFSSVSLELDNDNKNIIDVETNNISMHQGKVSV